MSKVAQATRNRRKTAYVWVAVMAAVVIALMVTEQIALLYVLATVGLTILLLIVAFSDLRGRQDVAGASLAAGDDAAAIGSGLSGAVGAATTARAGKANQGSRQRR
jgi:hypothetical protein